jgi:stage III sporulation protein AH
MVIEQKINPVKHFFMKIGKRNLMIIGAALLVGAAICLNVVLFNGSGNDDSYKGYDEPSGITGESGGENSGSVSDNYFASAQVSRKRARDEAMQVLQSVVDSENADDEAVAQALSDIAKMAMTIEKESNIETLITAKGFENCVAVINGDSARIIVSGSQLTPAQIAQINEIVYEETKILPVNITITEKAN